MFYSQMFRCILRGVSPCTMPCLPRCAALILCSANIYTVYMRRLLRTLCTCTLATLWPAGHALADGEGAPADSIYLLEVVEISADQAMRTTLTAGRPLARSLLSPQQLLRYDVADLTALTSRVPGLYIPDYGSRRSTAVYLRGVGARSSGQTIGLYVDGIPTLSKSAFNLDLLGIKQVEALRGPQGTLYGRNAMAGIINLYTQSAWDGDRGEVRLRLGNYRALTASALVHQRIGKHWGVSLGLMGAQRDGYFHNTTTNARQDSLGNLGAYAKIEYRPDGPLGAVLSARYDRVAQGGFPYRRMNASGTLADLETDAPSTYQREALQVGLNLRYSTGRGTLVSSTGYQQMSELAEMDMDYSARALIAVQQPARERAITQEVVWRNANGADRWQWSVGAFAFYDYNDITAHVRLGTLALRAMIQPQLDAQRRRRPSTPYMQIDATRDIDNPNYFRKPEWGYALYHESTLRDLFVPGLSVTAGLRLDYSRQGISYDSALAMRLGISTSGTAAGPYRWVESPTHLVGRHSTSTLQLLPRFAVQYEWGRWAVFISAAKGFKAGGYNEQTLNDIVRTAQMADLAAAASGGRAPRFDATNLGQNLAYGAETAWNYEAGIRATSLGFVEALSASAYYLNVHDLQLTKFVQSDAGRMISNAGGSHTIGAELSARLRLADNLAAHINYAYTDARFDTAPSTATDGERARSGLFVPFIPRHTYSAMLSAMERPSGAWITSYYADLELLGLGKTYWTEDNAYHQGGSLTLSGRIGVGIGNFDVALWGKNLLDSRHETFFFRLMGSSLAQTAAPRTFGIDLSYRL